VVPEIVVEGRFEDDEKRVIEERVRSFWGLADRFVADFPQWDGLSTVLGGIKTVRVREDEGRSGKAGNFHDEESGRGELCLSVLSREGLPGSGDDGFFRSFIRSIMSCCTACTGWGGGGIGRSGTRLWRNSLYISRPTGSRDFGSSMMMEGR